MLYRVISLGAAAFIVTILGIKAKNEIELIIKK